jgi:uncharacterized membrane protein (DUF373 family)
MVQPQESLVDENKDPLIHNLNRVVVWGVKYLAILMVLVIVWSLVDVSVHIALLVMIGSVTRFSVEHLITILGSFLAVLIAIEVFLNIIFYLKRDAIHVPLVLSTALTAVARKVIILDYNAVSPQYVYGIAAVIFALGLTYWLVTKKEKLT